MSSYSGLLQPWSGKWKLQYYHRECSMWNHWNHLLQNHQDLSGGKPIFTVYTCDLVAQVFQLLEFLETAGWIFYKGHVLES